MPSLPEIWDSKEQFCCSNVCKIKAMLLQQLGGEWVYWQFEQANAILKKMYQGNFKKRPLFQIRSIYSAVVAGISLSVFSGSAQRGVNSNNSWWGQSINWSQYRVIQWLHSSPAPQLARGTHASTNMALHKTWPIAGPIDKDTLHFYTWRLTGVFTCTAENVGQL